MFNPDVLPQLYGVLAPPLTPRRRTSSEDFAAATHRRDQKRERKRIETLESSMADDGGKIRSLSRKMSIKKIGSALRLGARARSSVENGSNLTAIQSSGSDDEDASDTTERGQQSVDLGSFLKSSRSEGEGAPVYHKQQGHSEDLKKKPPTLNFLTAVPFDKEGEVVRGVGSQREHLDATSEQHLDIREHEVDGTPTRGGYHQRNESLHVNLTYADVKRLAGEIYEETIADVNLSLFGYWIKESDRNYEMAKEYIRELALDKGYNIERIANVHLRTLLIDVKLSRPKYARLLHHRSSLRRIPGIPNLRQPGLSWIDENWDVPRPPTAHSNASSETMVAYSPSLVTNNELSSAACDTLLEQHAAIDLEQRNSIHPTRSSSLPITARADTLPPSFRAERERVLREAARSSSMNTILSTSERDYPPNTPDRPAPLSLRSPSSTASTLTPNATNFPPSISSSARDQRMRNLTPLYLPRNSVILQDTASHPLLSAPAASGTDDIFGIRNRGLVRDNGPLTATRVGPDYATALQRFEDEDNHGRYELDASDAASDDEYDSDGFLDEDEEELSQDNSESASFASVHSSVNVSNFSALESYTGSSDDVSNSASTSYESGGDEEQEMYAYTLPSPESLIPIPVGVPAEARRRCHTPSQNPMGTSGAAKFHRPLPPRSYEGEAQAEQAAKEEEDLEQRIAHIKRRVDLLTQSGGVERTQGLDGAMEERIYGSSTRSEHLASVSTMTIYISVDRATSPFERKRNTVTATDLLQRIPPATTNVSIVDWLALPPFERTWREINAQLLVSVYGTREVELNDGDVDYIDGISKTLREGAAASMNSDWVRGIFLQG